MHRIYTRSSTLLARVNCSNRSCRRSLVQVEWLRKKKKRIRPRSRCVHHVWRGYLHRRWQSCTTVPYCCIVLELCIPYAWENCLVPACRAGFEEYAAKNNMLALGRKGPTSPVPHDAAYCSYTKEDTPSDNFFCWRRTMFCHYDVNAATCSSTSSFVVVPFLCCLLLAASRTPARPEMVLFSNGSAGRRRAAVTDALATVFVALWGVRSASAFGLGLPLSSTKTCASANGNDRSTNGSCDGRLRRAVTMTAKPSHVFVAGATGRLGQRVVR